MIFRCQLCWHLLFLLHAITQSLNNIILIIKDKPEAADIPEAPPTTIASASSISSSIIRLYYFHIRLIFLWRQKQIFLKKELLPKSLPWLPFWESSPFFVSYRNCVMVYPVCCLKKRIIWVGSEKCRRKAILFTEKAVNNKSFFISCNSHCSSRWGCRNSKLPDHSLIQWNTTHSHYLSIIVYTYLLKMFFSSNCLY